MPLPSSGAITLNQIHVEAGGSSGTQAALNDTDIRAMIGKSSGASNSFSEYYGVSASAPTATYKGRLQTTGNGFPSGSISLSSGTKVVVVCCQLAGSNTNTYVSLGGTNMTLAARENSAHPLASGGSIWTSPQDVAIYYMTTSLSGSQSIQGNGGIGRSTVTVYEITGYNSATPYTTDTAKNTNLDATAAITVASQYNGVTIGSAVSEDGTTQTAITVSNADEVQQVHLESATAHVSWKDEGTPSGNRTYTYTNTSPGPTIGGGSGMPINLVTASWK